MPPVIVIIRQEREHGEDVFYERFCYSAVLGEFMVLDL
jgi:hypothetical protein